MISRIIKAAPTGMARYGTSMGRFIAGEYCAAFSTASRKPSLAMTTRNATMARSVKGERKRPTRGGSRSMSTVTPMWRPCAHGRGRTHHAHPDHEVAGALFRPRERDVNHETEEDLEENDDGHGGSRRDQKPLRSLMEGVREPVDPVRNPVHASLPRFPAGEGELKRIRVVPASSQGTSDPSLLFHIFRVHLIGLGESSAGQWRRLCLQPSSRWPPPYREPSWSNPPPLFP